MSDYSNDALHTWLFTKWHQRESGKRIAPPLSASEGNKEVQSKALEALNRVAFQGTWLPPGGSYPDEYYLHMGDVDPRISISGRRYFDQLSRAIEQATSVKGLVQCDEYGITIHKLVAEAPAVIKLLTEIPVEQPAVSVPQRKLEM